MYESKMAKRVEYGATKRFMYKAALLSSQIPETSVSEIAHSINITSGI